MPTALIIGDSDGIGLALAHLLLEGGWRVAGVSRSPSPEADRLAAHLVCDVTDPDYRARLGALCDELGHVDACIYCAGIGEPIALDDLASEAHTFRVNLDGAVTTAEVLIPRFVAGGAGHLIGLSSQADRFTNADAPAYAASKSGLSTYLEGLALACRPRGVFVTNVRLGFVDTKMAKSEVRPFMMSAESAARLVVRCLRKRPIRVTRPRRMAALLWVLRWGPRLRIWWS